MDIILGDMAQKSHSYFRPNWHAASSSLYCYQLEAFVDMLGSCSSECFDKSKVAIRSFSRSCGGVSRTE
ncbi:hypothetical protein ACE6H2_000751 [Prunus campanulata]